MQITAGGDFFYSSGKVLLSAGLTFLAASLTSYLFLYLVSEFQHSHTPRPLKPLLSVRPAELPRLLSIPPLAVYTGTYRIWEGIRTLLFESFFTKTFTDFEAISDGTRFRARGKAVPRDFVHAPITQENAVIVFWAIDGWTGTRWKTKEQELRSGRFYVESINDYGESNRVFVNPDEDAEYSVTGGTQTIVEVEKDEAIPEYLRSFIQENAPFAPDHIRFREIVVAPGDPVSVFGELYEQNVDGGWENVVNHPSESGVNIIVSTEDVSRLESEVWRDASASLVWGLFLLATSFTTLGVLSLLTSYSLPSLL